MRWTVCSLSFSLLSTVFLSVYVLEAFAVLTRLELSFFLSCLAPTDDALTVSGIIRAQTYTPERSSRHYLKTHLRTHTRIYSADTLVLAGSTHVRTVNIINLRVSEPRERQNECVYSVHGKFVPKFGQQVRRRALGRNLFLSHSANQLFSQF